MRNRPQTKVGFSPVLLALALAFLFAAPAAADEIIRISALNIRTWLDGSERTFLALGQARIEAPGGVLAGDAMVIWFDEQAARDSGLIKLRVYTETGGLGSITTIEAAGGLVLDDRTLTAYGAPPDSAVLSRARQAARPRPSYTAAAAQGARTVPPPTAQKSTAATASEPAPAEGSPRPSLFEQVGPEPVELVISDVDQDGYNSEEAEIDGRPVRWITGGIELTFGRYSMRADNMVIYLPPDMEDKIDDFQVYAEGNIRFKVPAATIDAERVFYDYMSNQATLIGAEVYAPLAEPGQQIILRAAKVRALSGGSFEAVRAYVTTCDFAEPHYRLESRSITMIPTRDAEGAESAIVTARSNRLYLGVVPVLYWPRFSRDIKSTHVPLKRLSVGDSSQFGTYVYTAWDVLDILAGDSGDSWAARASSWADVSALLDYRGDRGAGAGIESAYSKEGLEGEFLGYYIKDRGTDVNGFLPPHDDRGRVFWRQRTLYEQYQIDTELSYIGDRGFLNEYYEREAKEEKEQESYIYVKRPWEHAQGAFLYRARLNDFQTQTEYLPQGRIDAAGMPLFGDSVVYSSTTRVDNVRQRFDEMTGTALYQTQRADTLHTFEAPLRSAAGFTAAPFASVRGSWFEDTPSGGGTERFAGSWGAHVGFPSLWRAWDVQNAALDINRLRHVVNLDFTYEDVYDSTRRATRLLQFDDIDSVSEMKVATIRLRNRLQTRRAPVREGDTPRTVDLVMFDAEADFFPEPGRDNAGDNWSDVRLLSRLHVTDDVSLITDADYDTHAGRFDNAGVWLRFDHSPRTVWALGNRFLRASDQSVLTTRVDHVITDRWAVAALAQYDHDRGRMLDDEVILTRSIHEFALDIYFRFDEGRDDTTVGVSVHPLGVLAPTRSAYRSNY